MSGVNDLAKKKFTFFTHPLFLGVCLTIVILSYFYWDKSITIYFQQFDQSIQASYAHFITQFGEGTYYLIVLIVAMASFKWLLKNRKLTQITMYLFITLVVSGMACNILKLLFARARPTLLINHYVYGFWNYQFDAQFRSFPSGHATTIMALTMGLSLVWPRYRFGFLLFGFCVAFSRIIVMAHYLSDVLAGAVLGIISAVIMYRYCIVNKMCE